MVSNTHLIKISTVWTLPAWQHLWPVLRQKGCHVLFEATIFDTTTSSLGTSILRVRFQTLSLSLAWIGQLCSWCTQPPTRSRHYQRQSTTLNARTQTTVLLNTLQDTVHILNLLRLPSQNFSFPTLHTLRTTNSAGDSQITALVKEEAQLDPEYLSVTTAAEEGQLPENDGLVWHTCP